MLNYKEQVREYLEENFRPGTPQSCGLKRTTGSLLTFLFKTFPQGCINDYDLDMMLTDLGYKRHVWVEEFMETAKSKKKEVKTVRKELVTGWCLDCDYDLEPVTTEKLITEVPNGFFTTENKGMA